MWVGAPGEPIPTGVAIRITNLQNGEPVAGATVTWESFGPNGVVVHASAQSDAKGLASAVWQLGTSAGEQQLLVSVRSGQRTGELKLRALAVPHVVAQLRISVDSLTVVRLGDSLPISVTAVDPYGNVFAPSAPRLSSTDSTVGMVTGSVFVAGPRRGVTELEIVSDYMTAHIPLRVVQHVAAIIPETNALTFTSLGAQLPIRYTVVDDRGRLVADTTATLSLADTTIAQLSDTVVGASKPGSTELRFSVGAATTTIPVAVQQRIALLRLQPDTVRFDALRDTTTIQLVAIDSLGFPVLNPDLVYELSDAQVVTLAGASLLEATNPGVSALTLRDPITGVSATMPIVVQQRVSTIQVSPITFDALEDTVPITVMAVDRLGSPVAGASLAYSINDPGVATIESGGRLRSHGQGNAVVTVSDLDNGATGSADIVVSQRVASLSLSADSLAFDALGDSVLLSVVARDRLGELALSATASCSSSDPSVAAVGLAGVVHSLRNGSSMIVCRSTEGPADTAIVDVAQRVDRIQLSRDTLIFESLNAVLQVPAIPVDRLGSSVQGVPIAYAASDSTVAHVDSAGNVQAIGNGTASITLLSGGVREEVWLRVQQRPVRVLVSTDTIHFDALGDSHIVTAVALDSLGSTVVNAESRIVTQDSVIAQIVDATTVRAMANGFTQVKVVVGDAEADFVVSVRQIPTRIVTTLQTSDSVLDVSFGSTIPVICEARDRNDYRTPDIPSVEPSAGARWVGTRCDSLRALRSGADTLRVTVGTAYQSVGLVLTVGPPAQLGSAPFVARTTVGPEETFVSWLPPDDETRRPAIWVRTLGESSWLQQDVADRQSSVAFQGFAPGTTLEIATALAEPNGSTAGSRVDTVTVGDGAPCRRFAGYAGYQLRVFCTGGDLLDWISSNGLDAESVHCRNESVAALRDDLPNCVYEAGSERLVLLRGLDNHFRPGPTLSRSTLRAAYLQTLFGRSGPEATIWQPDPAFGNPLPVARVGAVTGYQSAVSWSTSVNAVGSVTWFEPPNPNGGIVIYHEGHGGDATDIGAETISWLLQRNWSVVALTVPRMDHMDLRNRNSNEANPLWRMLYGIGQVTEWVHRSWAPDHDPVVVAVGRSGGGWASLLYAALDERIDATAVVSGFVPLSQRLDVWNLGDWEQIDPVTFGSIDYTDIVRLADTRELLLTYSEFDDCCFRVTAADPFKEWLDQEALSAPAKLTTVLQSGRQHGLASEGYAALGRLLDRALARGH
jgi:dienelactone hydrolase